MFNIKPRPTAFTTGLLPVCVQPDVVRTLVLSLPRPGKGAPAEIGRLLITGALAMMELLRPRDLYEAMLVGQIIALQAQAGHEGELIGKYQAETERRQRHVRTQATLQRSVGTLRRQLREYRHETEAVGYAPYQGGVWEYQLPELEALWTDAEVERVAEVAEMKAAVAAAPGAKVTMWQKAGRTYIHELSDAELAELTEAEKRGVMLPCPPMEPGDPAARFVPEPVRPKKSWEEMTMQERRERYGYPDQAQFIAQEEAYGAKEGG
jgi:hypothetical protein